MTEHESTPRQAGQAGAQSTIELEEDYVVIPDGVLSDIIQENLMSHFSDADVNGLVLSEGEARYIAGGILLRAKQGFLSQGSPEKN